eukprot:scaffold188183_cov35-Tisochrysis_lutea.AAC.3
MSKGSGYGCPHDPSLNRWKAARGHQRRPSLWPPMTHISTQLALHARTALALEFKASQPADAEALIDEEQKEMMRAVCASIHGKDDLFRCVCTTPSRVVPCVCMHHVLPKRH